MTDCGFTIGVNGTHYETQDFYQIWEDFYTWAVKEKVLDISPEPSVELNVLYGTVASLGRQSADTEFAPNQRVLRMARHAIWSKGLTAVEVLALMDRTPRILLRQILYSLTDLTPRVRKTSAFTFGTDLERYIDTLSEMPVFRVNPTVKTPTSDVKKVESAIKSDFERKRISDSIEQIVDRVGALADMASIMHESYRSRVKENEAHGWPSEKLVLTTHQKAAVINLIADVEVKDD